MSKGLYAGVNGTARKAKALYAGVNGVARKVIKGYIGNEQGIACQFWPAVVQLMLSYSGAYTLRQVTYQNILYDEWELTGSGSLTVQGAGDALVWLCGGGSGGAHGTITDGGNGAYAASGAVALLPGSYAITIGAGGTGGTSAATASAGGQTTALGLTAAGGTAPRAVLSYDIVTSGTGGGGGGVYGTENLQTSIWRGDGRSKIPFGDATNHSAICAGGGGGAYWMASYNVGGIGGNGGTNGSPGGLVMMTGSIPGRSPGGATGGGAGGAGSRYTLAGQAATTPGSGGGGGGTYDTGSYTYGNGGAGYRGVVYIRVAV
ncbi:MAG: hypothetical protein LBN04_08230 [Oscillospiraceae bacterium]|jgi:hypothetical protein|nr:hypothetical protein [Oscillospiraceae bacterium]